MKKVAKHYNVIVLGAGGAGLMCAAAAGQRGKKALVIDHNDQPGKKILISGGGRCNFTNLDVRPESFISRNPHFAISALARYTQHDFLALVEKHNIDWHEKTLGQLFCSGSAKQIVKMLLDECVLGSVTTSFSEDISSVCQSDGQFVIETSKASYAADSLVVATGGPSIPKLGATGFAYELAKQFRLKIVEPKPALVPLTLSNAETLFAELSGVATNTIVSNGKASFEEATLFTHQGLSGPAILQISSYWQHGEKIFVNYLPNIETDWLVERKREHPKNRLKKAMAAHLPDRLAEALSNLLDQSERTLTEYRDAELEEYQSKLAKWPFTPKGTEGFAKAEVTLGGVSTDELSSRTMESKKVPGLYFIGEAVDVTGWLGGYNFQWAWSSGHAAGQSV